MTEYYRLENGIVKKDGRGTYLFDKKTGQWKADVNGALRKAKDAGICEEISCDDAQQLIGYCEDGME